MISRWFVLLLAIASTALAGTSTAGNGKAHIQFIQQDTVQAFDLVTGTGYQVGTATGDINGTTFVSFQFTPAAPPTSDPFPINFANKVIVTDVDGDQLLFDNNGTGSFHVGISPGFRGSGGPLQGTYVLTAGTGKYATWPVGNTYTYRAIMTNPPSPAGALGTVYVEVSGPQK